MAFKLTLLRLSFFSLAATRRTARVTNRDWDPSPRPLLLPALHTPVCHLHRGAFVAKEDSGGIYFLLGVRTWMCSGSEVTSACAIP
ncbi:hypothetical protein GN956_G26522 [Arapaima gigas]